MRDPLAGTFCHRPTWVVSVVAGVILTVSGCAQVQETPVDGSPVAVTDELGSHGGRPCPARLPLGDGPDADLGVHEPASSLPTLPTASRVWVCRYDPVDAGPRDEDGDGTT